MKFWMNWILNEIRRRKQIQKVKWATCTSGPRVVWHADVRKRGSLWGLCLQPCDLFPLFFSSIASVEWIPLSLSLVPDSTCHAGDVRKDYWMNGDVTKSWKKREKKRKRESWVKSVQRISKPPRSGSGPWSRASRRQGDAEVVESKGWADSLKGCYREIKACKSLR